MDSQVPSTLRVEFDETSFTARYRGRGGRLSRAHVVFAALTFLAGGAGLVVLPEPWSWVAAIVGYVNLILFLWGLWSLRTQWTWVRCSLDQIEFPDQVSTRRLPLGDLQGVAVVRLPVSSVLRLEHARGTLDLAMSPQDAKWIARQIRRAYRQAGRRQEQWGHTDEVPEPLADLRERT